MKKMELKKFILENREDFDTEQLPEGHEGRFSQKLNNSKVNSGKKNIFILKVAASIILVVGISGLLFFNLFSIKIHADEKAKISVTTSDFIETRNYFEEQVKLGLNQLKSLVKSNTEQLDSIAIDLKNMDDNCSQLEEELKDNPNDERIMQAIIGLYQVKLDALNQILTSVALTSNQIKTKGNENNI